MLGNGKLRILGLIAVVFIAFSSVRFYQLLHPSPLVSSAVYSAQPKSLLGNSDLTESSITGGRARGGTLNRPAPAAPAPSRSPGYSGGYSAPSRPYSSPYYSDPFPAPVIVPAPYPNYVPVPGYSVPIGDTGGGDVEFLLVLLVIGLIVLPIVINFLRSASTASSSGQPDRVTVTQLQIGLLAQARDLQQDLTQLTANADLSTQAGLTELLRETVLALLRSPQYWTHALSNSQTLPREPASRLFEQRSIEARSKYSVETLVNVQGTVRQQTFSASEERDPAAYIVVTMLAGTTDDRPLLGRIHSTNELRAALQRLGSIAPENLLVYELIWTPQAAGDSLSRDELIAYYPGLVQL
jgi:uncharacterized membrane protein